MESWQAWALGGAALTLLLVLLWRSRRWQTTLRGWRTHELIDLFARRRPALLEEFLAAARGGGTPRGLRWKHAEWEPTQTLARDRTNGLYVMLVPVTLQFEAIEGEEMEDVAAVGLAKQATGLFFFDGGAWRTRGKAVFNLGPDEALRHFAAQYERLG